MAARSKARKRALDILFASELRSEDPVVALDRAIEAGEGPTNDYTSTLVRGVVEHWRATLEADKRAFVRLMQYLRDESGATAIEYGLIAVLIAMFFTVKRHYPAVALQLSTDPVTLRFTWWGSDARHKRTQQVIDLFTAKNPTTTVSGEFSATVFLSAPMSCPP